MQNDLALWRPAHPQSTERVIFHNSNAYWTGNGKRRILPIALILPIELTLVRAVAHNKAGRGPKKQNATVAR
jgi:hypothetical protein